MSQLHEDLSETHILGARTRQWIVRVSRQDDRPWLAEALVCPALGQHQIAHVGIAEARAPYRIVRPKQSGIYFMACFGGAGRVLVDGRWQLCRAGQACLLPLHILNAFHAEPQTRWDFCWVRYQQPPEQKPITSAASPVLVRFDAQPLRAAILGLFHECRAGGGGAGGHSSLGGIDSNLRAALCPAVARGRPALAGLGKSRGQPERGVDPFPARARSAFERRTLAPSVPPATRTQPDAPGHLPAHAQSG